MCVSASLAGKWNDLSFLNGLSLGYILLIVRRRLINVMSMLCCKGHW